MIVQPQKTGKWMNNASALTERMIKAAKDSRKRFYDEGSEIARYCYAPDYKFEYQSLPSAAFFKAKVALSAEAVRVFGPYLYQVNPHRTFVTRPNATPQISRVAEIVGDYLNYTPGKLDLYHTSRRAINDAISWGRGCVWTDVDKTTGLVGSEQFSARDLLMDPDCRTWKSSRWIARRYRKTRVEAKEIYPDAKWDLCAKGGKSAAADDVLPWENRSAKLNDMVTYWCIYTKHGLSGIEGFTELQREVQNSGEQTDLSQPAVFIVSDEGKCMDMQPWPVPLYKEDEFPCTELDFYEGMESAWPVSPLAPAMGYQRCVNFLVTLMMGKYRFTSRTVGAIMKQAGEGLSDSDMGKVLMGADIEMLNITVKGEVRDLKQFLSEFNWSHDYLVHGMNLLNLMESRFQKASGLYEILYSGETGTQSRSATDASVKDRNSQSRVRDMRDQVEKWAGRVARKEAQTLRFLKDRDHITAVLGEQAGKDWGFLVKPGGDDVNAMVEQFSQQFMQAGMPPMIAQQNALQMAQSMASQAIDFERWMLETDYSIEADSIKRRDVDQRIDALKELFNQFTSTQIQSMDPMEKALGYDTAAAYMDAIGADKAVVQANRDYANNLRQMAMNPPPVPLPQQAAPPQPGA